MLLAGQPQNESSIGDAWDADSSDTNRSEWQSICVKANVLVLSCGKIREIKRFHWLVTKHKLRSICTLWHLKIFLIVESLFWYLWHATLPTHHSILFRLFKFIYIYITAKTVCQSQGPWNKSSNIISHLICGFKPIEQRLNRQVRSFPKVQ